jgi:Dehydrogenases with different specificities (related to short-chain alcohol dehydrogenases)
VHTRREVRRVARARLASSCASGIRVNGVAPATAAQRRRSLKNILGPAGLEKAAESSDGPRRRAEDIADVILFLVSDGARYITGQTITVDGGVLVGRY